MFGKTWKGNVKQDGESNAENTPNYANGQDNRLVHIFTHYGRTHQLNWGLVIQTYVWVSTHATHMQTHDVMARCISAVGVKEKVSVSGWMDREGDGGTF